MMYLLKMSLRASQIARIYRQASGITRDPPLHLVATHSRTIGFSAKQESATCARGGARCIRPRKVSRSSGGRLWKRTGLRGQSTLHVARRGGGVAAVGSAWNEVDKLAEVIERVLGARGCPSTTCCPVVQTFGNSLFTAAKCAE